MLQEREFVLHSYKYMYNVIYKDFINKFSRLIAGWKLPYCLPKLMYQKLCLLFNNEKKNSTYEGCPESFETVSVSQSHLYALQ